MIRCLLLVAVLLAGCAARQEPVNPLPRDYTTHESNGVLVYEWKSDGTQRFLPFLDK
jgi:hypothetical protein